MDALAGYSTPRLRRALLIAASALLTLAFAPSVALPASKSSPDAEITIVSNNLHEGYDNADLEDLSEVKVFVRRVLDTVPHSPDLVLLQEVRNKSAKKVAKVLSNKTSDDYKMAVAPGELPTQDFDNRQVFTDTSVVVNQSTMKITDDGGYLSTTYDREDGLIGEKLAVKRHAYLEVKERSSGLRMSVASLHLSPENKLVSLSVSQTYRKTWVDDIAGFLEAEYPDADMSIIGGDFNTERCKVGTGGDTGRLCVANTWWDTLTSSPYSYTDLVTEVIGGSPVDYIFATADVIDAGKDDEIDDERSSEYYSNHAFRWAEIEPSGS